MYFFQKESVILDVFDYLKTYYPIKGVVGIRTQRRYKIRSEFYVGELISQYFDDRIYLINGGKGIYFWQQPVDAAAFATANLQQIAMHIVCGQYIRF